MATAKEKKETTAKAVETAATEKTATPVTETATAKKPAAKTASKAKTATKTAAKAPAKAKTASKTTKTATKAKEEVFIQLGGNGAKEPVGAGGEYTHICHGEVPSLTLGKTNEPCYHNTNTISRGG